MVKKRQAIFALQTALEMGQQVYQPGGKLLILFKIGKLSLQLLK